MSALNDAIKKLGLGFTPPAPPDPFEAQARELRAEAVFDAMTGNPNGGTISFKRTPTGAELREAHEAKEREAREIAEAPAREAALASKVGEAQAEVARIEKAIKTAESKARTERINRAAEALAADRAARGKKPIEMPELRSRAVTELARLDSNRKRLGE